ncbi:MAG: hypothetical protein AAF725_21830 [Acidobacteriota bacterium]
MRIAVLLCSLLFVAAPALGETSPEVDAFGNVIAEVVEKDGVRIEFHETPDPTLLGRVLARPLTRQIEKVDQAGDELVLPHYEVDLTNPGGRDTLFAVHNVTSDPTTIIVSVRSNLGTGDSQTVPLAPNETRSFSVRNFGGLAPNVEGIATGWVEILEEGAISAFPTSVIQGDYFLVDPENDFASGDRLLNTTEAGSSFDLCRNFDIRFFNGGGFDGGTDVFFYVNELLPGPAPELSFVVFDEAGALRGSGNLNLPFQNARISASALVGDVPFGMLKFGFISGFGHLSSTLNALGRFSVGVNGLCQNPVDLADP